MWHKTDSGKREILEPQIAVLNQGTIGGNIITVRAAMVEAVDRCARTDFKIVKVIICGVAVNVMDNLTPSQLPP